MKKIFLLSCLLLLFFAKAQAAPYNLDAPIESYTWGESMKTVWDSRPDDNSWQMASEDFIYVIQESKPVFFLRFWNGRLAGISKSSGKMTQEEKDTLYSGYLKDFTAKWGKPGPEKPCVANAAICSEVIWHVNANTQVSLNYSTKASERPFIGYSYSSREMQPKYEQEIGDFGLKYKAEHLIMIFGKKPEYAEKTMKGQRVRVEALVVSTAPLVLEDKGAKINGTLRNNKDAKSLVPRQIVMISGVFEDVKDNTVRLSDVILVPYSQEGGIAVNRGGKPPKGFFAVETLNRQLEMAANQVNKGFSIRQYLSAPRLENKQAIVDFILEGVSGEVFFSLDALYADKSSDTLSFNMHLKEDQRSLNGYVVLAMVSTLLKTTQPDASADELWGKIERAMKGREAGKGKMRGKTIINGWTYEIDTANDRNLTFSATAPKMR